MTFSISVPTFFSFEHHPVFTPF